MTLLANYAVVQTFFRTGCFYLQCNPRKA